MSNLIISLMIQAGYPPRKPPASTVSMLAGESEVVVSEKTMNSNRKLRTNAARPGRAICGAAIPKTYSKGRTLMSYLTAAMVLSPNLEAENSCQESRMSPTEPELMRPEVARISPMGIKPEGNCINGGAAGIPCSCSWRCTEASKIALSLPQAAANISNDAMRGSTMATAAFKRCCPKRLSSAFSKSRRRRSMSTTSAQRFTEPQARLYHPRRGL
mmetsp:Transcript_28100/g.58010  ORF Transcript_28100/g.58010 Transcript_28100/m.58010 type:complete len:215 (-) Transcript_28100:477-1121(-)